MIHPLNARLGVTHFWMTNYLPTITSNFKYREVLRYQNFVDCLEKYLALLFSGMLQKLIFKHHSIIFNKFSFNCFSFPENVIQQRHFLMLEFFNFDNTFFRSLKSNAQRESNIFLYKSYFANLFRDRERHALHFLKTQKEIAKLFEFIQLYTMLFKASTRVIEKYCLSFKLFLNKLVFFSRLRRLYLYFFPRPRLFKLQLNLRIISFQKRITSNFLANFIYHKIKAGMFVSSVINLIFRLIKRNKKVAGLRIVCAGRYVLGPKAGYVIRSFGKFTFGTFNTENKGYHIDYKEKTILVRKGLIGLRIWVSTQVSHHNHTLEYPSIYNPSFRKKDLII